MKSIIFILLCWGLAGQGVLHAQSYALTSTEDDATDKITLKTVQTYGEGTPKAAYWVQHSPQGSYIMTTTYSGSRRDGEWQRRRTVRLWNAEGELTHEWPEVISGPLFAPDESYMLMRFEDSVLRIVKPDGTTIAKLEAHTEDINRYAISPTSGLIATAAEDSTLRLWSRTGKEVQTIRLNSGVKFVEFAPDGKSFVTVASSGRLSDLSTLNNEIYTDSILLFDTTGRRQTAFSTTLTQWNVNFSPKGTYLLAEVMVKGEQSYGIGAKTSFEEELRLYDRQGNIVHRPLRDERNSRRAYFTPDEDKLIIWQRYRNDTPYRITLSGNVEERFLNEADSADDEPSFYFAREGNLMARVYDEDRLELLTTAGEELLVIEDTLLSISDLDFSPDGKTFIISADVEDSLPVLQMRRVDDGKLLKSFVRPLEGHEETVFCAAFSPDGKQIVSGSADSTIRFWNRETGKVDTVFKYHKGAVTGIAFSPDGNYIATSSIDSTGRLLKADGTLIKELKGHTGALTGIDFLPDGRIVTASFDTTARIWNAEGQLVQTLAGHEGPVLDVACSPDGKHILTGSDDLKVKLYTADDGKNTKTYKGHRHYVNDVTFTADGEHFLTASADLTGRLWTTEGGVVPFTLLGHSYYLTSIAISPDGKYIVTADSEGTVYLWDGETGTDLTHVKEHSGPVYHVSFSPDGRYILTASADKKLMLMEIVDETVAETDAGE